MMLAAVLTASLQITSVRGERLRPLEPAGAANVLVFASTDCPVSNGYAPEIQRVCAAYASRGVACLLVYEDPDLRDEAARAHLSEYRYGAMTAAVDSDGSLAANVGATMTPEVAVIDRAGGVRYRGRIDNKYVAIGRARRTVTEHDLVNALDAVLAGRPVAVTEAPAVGCVIVPPEARRKKP